jgi:hypothetical protein
MVLEFEPTENNETEKQKDKETFRYECEEAKRHTEKAKNHWIRKANFDYLFIFLAFFVFGFLGFMALCFIPKSPQIFNKILAGAMGVCFILIPITTLFLRFYQEIFKGFSLYYFKTADGVLHAHLKKLSSAAAFYLPAPAIVKIGVCGWFRKSRLLRYEMNARGEIIVTNTYQGLKLYKARCDKETLNLSEVVLKDGHDDRITFTDINRLFDFLEHPDDVSSLPLRLEYALASIAKLAHKVAKGEKDLKITREEVEKYKKFTRMYAAHEQELIQWIEESKKNSNLGKSKHAQAIKQKLLEHQRTIKNTYGDLTT